MLVVVGGGGGGRRVKWWLEMEVVILEMVVTGLIIFKYPGIS